MFSLNDTLIVTVMLDDPDLPEHLDNVRRKNVFMYLKALVRISISIVRVQLAHVTERNILLHELYIP